MLEYAKAYHTQTAGNQQQREKSQKQLKKMINDTLHTEEQR